MSHLKLIGVFVLIVQMVLFHPAQAQSRNLAPDFVKLPQGAKVVIMPTDIELFSISAGGVAEPKADWTEAASKYFRGALEEKKHELGFVSIDLSNADSDEFAEVNALHAAVAKSISIHHLGALKLPTKEGKMDWSMGDAVQGLQQKTGADYALFSWVRDSYASAERKATMILLAAVGVGLTGGQQVGYASLVDLHTGQVVWFNRMFRGFGDLRDAAPAKASVDVLLTNFPSAL